MVGQKKPVWIFLPALILAGCAAMLSYDQIIQKADAVKASDGINRPQAVLIAQKFLIENGLDQRHDVYRVGEVQKEPDGSAWLVHFSGGVARGASETRRFGFTQPIIIRIDIADGKAGIAQ